MASTSHTFLMRLSGLKGFGKERAAGFQARSRLQHFVLSLNQGEARHIEHLQPGPLGPELRRELVAVQAWHHDIGR